ncbi:MAG: hypothetical protein AAGM04_05810 [Pseudomonadota bacterium]
MAVFLAVLFLVLRLLAVFRVVFFLVVFFLAVVFFVDVLVVDFLADLRFAVLVSAASEALTDAFFTGAFLVPDEALAVVLRVVVVFFAVLFAPWPGFARQNALTRAPSFRVKAFT